MLFIREVYLSCLFNIFLSYLLKIFTSFKPIINQGRSRSEYELRQGRGWLETRGDILIRGLWESRTEAIIFVRLGGGKIVTFTRRS